MMCHEYISEYDLDAHINEIRNLYRAKCDLMLKTLDENMPNEVTYTRPEGGLFHMGNTFPTPLNEPEFVKKAIEHKVAVVPGETFRTAIRQCLRSRSE